MQRLLGDIANRRPSAVGEKAWPREGLAELGGVAEAVCWYLGKRLEHDSLEAFGNRRSDTSKIRHRIQDVARENRVHARSCERRLAGEHLVEHAAEAVDVAAPVEFVEAARLLGTHVGRCADDDAGGA